MENPDLRQLNQEIEELIKNEALYLKRLELIRDLYLSCLEEEGYFYPEIWNNIQTLIPYHSMLLKSLEQAYKDETSIGKVFVDTIPAMRQIYSFYYQDFDRSIKALNELKTSDQKLNNLLQELDQSDSMEEFKGRDLLSHLTKPTQRFPAYDLIVKQLAKLQKESNPEEVTILENAQIEIFALISHVEKRAILREQQFKLLQICNTFQNIESSEIIQPFRIFIDETNEFQVKYAEDLISSFSSCTLYMLNDMLIFVTSKLLGLQQNEKLFMIKDIKKIDLQQNQKREEMKLSFTAAHKNTEEELFLICNEKDGLLEQWKEKIETQINTDPLSRITTTVSENEKLQE